MAENKKSVLLYCDIIHTVETLTDDEAGRLFKHFLRYINDLNPEPPDRLTQITFEPIKQNLKRDLKKWESKSERNSLIAKDGWIKRKNANASESTKKDAKHADKDKVIVIVKDKDINIPFGDFWDLYNKKVGNKDSCISKWKKLTDDDRKKIINTLPLFLSTITEKKFQPHPQTYLNQKRWNDEISHLKPTEEKRFKCQMRNEFGEYYPMLTQKEIDNFKSQRKECNVL